MRPSPSRREFLESLGYSAAALAAAGYAERPAFAANETLGIGLIGCGGRMHVHLAPALLKTPGVKILAACDVYSEHRKSIAAKIGTDLAVTTAYEEILARKDIDAVVIATPDHLHVPLTIAACNAGKDVYCEKPFTHNVAEGAAAVDAQNKNKRIVQIGTQQRSMTHLIEAKKVLDTGVLGKIIKVRMTWNRAAGRRAANAKYNIKPEQVEWKRFLGTAPDQPFNAYKMRQWRWYWDFGGGLFTDLMVHWFDTVNWMLDLSAPESAASIGDYFLDYSSLENRWDTPDTAQTLMRFKHKGEPVQVMFESTFTNSSGRAMTQIMGEHATLYFDRGRYELRPEPNTQVEAKQLVLGSGEAGADFYDQPDGEILHLGHWIDCVRSRTKPNCPAEAGVSSAAAAHFANRSLREGKIVTSA